MSKRSSLQRPLLSLERERHTQSLYERDTRKRNPTLLHVASAATISSPVGKATTLASVAPFAPPWLVDCIQSCLRAEAQVSILVIAPIDGHTRLVLVAQELQLCLPGTLFPQRWQVLAVVLSGFCKVLAPSCAQVSIGRCCSVGISLRTLQRKRHVSTLGNSHLTSASSRRLDVAFTTRSGDA